MKKHLWASLFCLTTDDQNVTILTVPTVCVVHTEIQIYYILNRVWLEPWFIFSHVQTSFIQTQATVNTKDFKQQSDHLILQIAGVFFWR